MKINIPLFFLLLVCSLFSNKNFAQQIELFQQFNGRYDYTAFGNTLNIEENGGGGACDILTQSSAEFNLQPTQTLVAALLYWSGSGTGDFNVKLNGNNIVAERTFAGNFTGLNYFSAYADVTAIVFNQGNGTYTLSDLDLTTVIPAYCGSATNYGGWSILVIYQEATLSQNQIGVFDGFEAVWAVNPVLDFVLENIEVASPDLAKIGFLAWEGDKNIAVNETLTVNGIIMSNPPLNPADNAFNGTNSFTGSSQLFNMDLDFYNVENVINTGDTSIDIGLTSGQDLVIVNNVITVINSELPDATIQVEDIVIVCGNTDIDIVYTVYNVNSTDILPANTPIAFYADNLLVGQSQTVADIPIGGNEPGTINIIIPPVIPGTFILKVVVDDDGTGVGVVSETDENNNEFEIVVSISPIFIVDPPPPIIICDDIESGSTTDGISIFNLEEYKVILIGNNNFLVYYYETLTAQNNGFPIIDPIDTYANTSSPQTIYVTVVNSDLCELRGEFELIVPPNPIVLPITIEVCDDDNDGFYFFILSDYDDDITGGDPDLIVRYYGKEILAIEGDPLAVLPTPYFNDDPFIDFIWARVESITTGCFTVIEIQLIVNLIPVEPLEGFGDLIKCDENGDGQELFDLTLNTPFVIGSQIPPLSDYTVFYYLSELEAEIPINEILNPISFPSTGQTIWVRIENINTVCFNIFNFDLIVVDLPIIGSGPFMDELCDDMINGSTGTDGISTFNLALNNEDITLGDISLSVYYFESLNDQNAGISMAINPDTAYQNITTPQTLFVSVFNVEGCEERTLLTLTVLPNPTPVLPTPLEVCDDDNDGDNRNGFAEFTLEDKDAEITGNETGIIIRYYETQELAELGSLLDALVSPYTNQVAHNDVVWVRVEYDPAPPLNGTGCYTIIQLELIVNPLPDDSVVIEDVINCQLPFIGTSSIIFDTKDAEILNGQDPLIFDVVYFESQAEADAYPVTMISISSATPYFYDTTERTIYVGIFNLDTECYIATQSFILIVQEGVNATTPSAPYAICDNTDPNDGFAEFDLLNFDSNINGIDIAGEILGTQDPTIFIITYHESIENAMDNTNPISSPYTNVINPQIIYARVTNTDNTVSDDKKCHDIVEVILKVEELPNIDIEDEYRLCVDENGDPLPSEEGETSPPLIDTGLDPGVYTFVWEIDGVVIPGETLPFITATQGGVYTVTVTEIDTLCSSTATTTVTVSSPPFIYSAAVVSGAFGINEVIHTGPQGITITTIDTHVIHVSVEGLGTYVFQLDDGPFQESDLFVNVLPGIHIITIKDVNGCGSVMIEVIVIDYPRFVTPNQDGYHDTWNIIGIGTSDPTAKIYIFDRFGKLLKQISPIGEGWDGTYNGNPLPSSDYWFRVEYKEDNTLKEFKGHFTLKR